jgi:hypothetical protein
MNQHVSYVARVDSAAAKDARRKRRALECRTMRLYIAANPGSTSKQIFDGTGVRNADHLYRMLAMKIVRFTQQPNCSTQSRPQRWFVVPQ